LQFAKLLGAHVIVASSSDDKLQRAISLGLIVIRKVRLQGITVGNRDGMEAMMQAISQHAIRSVIDRTLTASCLVAEAMLQSSKPSL
jgi:D-arabinose 1-dehydrogenase-like Zn-dependent alcohol dehydrogenase